MITIELLLNIKEQFKIDWWGLHGVIHWHNAYLNSKLLAQQAGVNTRVVEYFSIFHDSQRFTEGTDYGHGQRGASLALALREHIHLDDDEFSLLQSACSLHTTAIQHDNLAIQICIDSDRLCLGRVGIYPDINLLLSHLAKEKEIIEQCYKRSLTHDLPEAPFGLTDFWDVFGGDKYTEWARGTNNDA